MILILNQLEDMMSEYIKEALMCIESNDSECLKNTIVKYGYRDGSVLPIQVLRHAFECNEIVLAMDLMERFKFDHLNDEQDPIIVSAAHHGNKKVFEKLITLGANLNALNHVKNSAVGAALFSKNYSAVHDLLDLGFQMRSYTGGLALRQAAWKGEFDFVRLFIVWC
ncbi:hypothetical protein ASG81_07740 [Paenibacillus sp. Soil522]|nr:hypothetical protein ASG81_07740 [Paenibacillus sp. Soil522]